MLTGIDHGSAALGAGLVVPRPYTVAAAIQADTSHQRCERRGRVANDSTDNQWLDSLAIRTADSLYMLAHKPTALIVVSCARESRCDPFANLKVTPLQVTFAKV